MDVRPVQGECFALPQAGADDQFEEVRERVVDVRAVSEEGGGLRRGPAGALGLGGMR